MRSKDLILRTHGGLGNQLFQVAYGRLYSKKFNLNLKEIHDSNYKHKFARIKELKQALIPNLRQRLISKFRLSKLIYKLLGFDGYPIYLFYDYYLDGYFQKTSQYEKYNLSDIKFTLLSIKKELNIKNYCLNKNLYHFRLLDFFKSKEDEVSHVISRVKGCKPGSDIITNNQKVFQIKAIKNILNNNKLNLIDTDNLVSLDVIKIISQYKIVISNDSTIAFWGALLSNSELIIKDAKLKETYKFLRKSIQI